MKLLLKLPYPQAWIAELGDRLELISDPGARRRASGSGLQLLQEPPGDLRVDDRHARADRRGSVVAFNEQEDA
ncbi:hypothetical protein G7007_07800 [Pseudomonas entomophila]|jgi:hypothetical protein|uniref:hypothetical protein n=1 Tax=Pseudomonas entomophila TaxID=312306 RepID=UPI0015E3019D|nr:hypothetical protein [Pseudomonas entomophila]MBA1192762.1 hypothetical protein [Pseudomonas entomophila]